MASSNATAGPGDRLRPSDRLLVVLMLGLTVWLGVRSISRPLPVSDVQPVRTGMRVNVNVASEATLSLLPGIGPGLASRIVAHRGELGPVHGLDQLQAVRGIGVKTASKVEPFVTFGADQAAGGGGDSP